jgi:hypothetical protein
MLRGLSLGGTLTQVATVGINAKGPRVEAMHGRATDNKKGKCFADALPAP